MRNLLTTEKSRYLTHLRKEMKVDERMMKYKKTSIMKVGENIQSPLVIVDSSVCKKMSTITSMYSKTPQSADFGTEQNCTADCEIRRL